MGSHVECGTGTSSRDSPAFMSWIIPPLALYLSRIRTCHPGNPRPIHRCPQRGVSSIAVESASTSADNDFSSYHSFYPDGPRKSDSYGRLRSPVTAQRIKDMLDSTQGTIVIGGESDVENRYVAPTVVLNPPEDDRLVTE